MQPSDYVSSHPGNLRAHWKTNSGEKLNKCNQCDFASSQAGKMRAHLKTYSGEKLNKCNQCDYALARIHRLKTHSKTHSERKSNKCFHETFQVDILVVCRKSLVIDHCGSGENALGKKSTLDLFDYLKGRVRKKGPFSFTSLVPLGSLQPSAAGP